jgi:hypothetical protein
MKVTAVFSYCSSFRKVAGILWGRGVKGSSEELTPSKPWILVFTTNGAKIAFLMIGNRM